MIVVFVVDTSPSMGRTNSAPRSGMITENSPCGLTRLDLAKMTIEAITKALNRRIQSHNTYVTSYEEQKTGSLTASLNHSGLGGRVFLDHFLLITTGYQNKASGNQTNDANSSAMGSRVLVDYGNLTDLQAMFEGEANVSPSQYHNYCTHLSENHAAFDKALKNLSISTDILSDTDFSENRGGVPGLNAALSAGLRLMSRYRLHNRWTENFGLGRLPSTSIIVHGALGVYGSSSTVVASSLHQTTQALQPACLILLTDGECLNQPPELGGGTLELQYGNMPLREFYKEPFRWDQRMICLCINSHSEDLHPSLKALCDVTGGFHVAIPGVSSIQAVVESLLRKLAPPFPSKIPFPSPLQTVFQPKANPSDKNTTGGRFVDGGPICSFLPLSSENRIISRAMLLYVPTSFDNEKYNTLNSTIPTPTWCIPEAFFPSNKFDTLPPRKAQPQLIYADVNNVMGFNPVDFIKALNRLDDLMYTIKQGKYPGQAKSQNIPLLQRDVYICEWLSSDGIDIECPIISARGQELFPIFVRGAGRSTTIDGTDNLLSIGILYVPRGCVTLSAQSSTADHSKLSTLTLLPPDAHLLLPLLIKAAEIEHRAQRNAVKRKEDAEKMRAFSTNRANGGSVATLIQKLSNSSYSSIDVQEIILDDKWKNELKNYMHRIPPYCLVSVKRCLKPMLHTSVHHLLGTDTIESITSQCFSRLCHQKIRAGEASAKDAVIRMDHRHDALSTISLNCDETLTQRYGQYDRKSSLSSYLAALRTINPPWNNNQFIPSTTEKHLSAYEQTRLITNEMITCLGDLPMNALLAYYDSRRRWIFGGCGQTVRGLFVEGVKKDSDSNLYRNNISDDDKPLIALSTVGASDLVQMKINKMGDFRERLFWSPQPFVGYGINDANRAVAATGPDGVPLWSVDDNALPLYYFDPMTGEFIDTPQTRIRSKLAVNFGNPFKIKRGDAVCPKKYERMSPSLDMLAMKDHEVICQPNIDLTNDAFIDGEGEADSIKICIGPPHKRSRSVSEKSNTDSHRCNHVVMTDIDQDGKLLPKQQDLNAHSALSSRVKPASPILKKPNITYLATHDRSKPPPPPPLPPPAISRPTQTQQLLEQAQDSRNSKIDSLLTLEGSVKANMQDPNNKPDIKLPDEWILVWSKSKNRWYYFDKRTNASVWEWPPPTI